jgi:succinyl-CoA synthetase beta subunit
MGEEAQANKLETALRIIFNDPYVKVALINIFGGVTGCDILALNMLQIVKDTQTHVPILVRMTGERAYEGQTIINTSGLSNMCHVLTLTEAVQKTVAAVSTQ